MMGAVDYGWDEDSFYDPDRGPNAWFYLIVVLPLFAAMSYAFSKFGL